MSIYPAWMVSADGGQIVQGVRIFETLRVSVSQYEPVTLKTTIPEQKIGASFQVIKLKTT